MLRGKICNMGITLYSYYRSSAAYRVRIALNLKGVDYRLHTLNLLTGEEKAAPYTDINPQGLVPMLEHDGHHLSQSMAILEYLEERYPNPPLLPVGAADRAWIRSLSNIIACDIHPLNNLRILKYLSQELDVEDGQKLSWYRHWVEQGFEALETHLLGRSNQCYCFGDAPGLADVLLIPQVYNARRFEVDMEQYPTINAIEQHCLSLPEFEKAAPENQPDAL